MEKYFSINQNGLSIRCKIYCRDIKRISSVIIFGHGFGGHKDTRAAAKMADKVQKRHPDVALLIFDWPCHGEDSSGKLRLDGCLTYLDTVIKYTEAEYKPEKLYACATSFGGYLFLNYISSYGEPFDRIALRCPAVNMYSVLTDRIIDSDSLKKINKGKPVPIGFDRKVKITREFLADIQSADISQIDFSVSADKILIIHGTKDEIVDFDSAKDFADKNGIVFRAVEAADHRFQDPNKMDEALNYIVDFYFN